MINQDNLITAYEESVEGGNLDVVDMGGYFSLQFKEGFTPTAAPVTGASSNPTRMPTIAPSRPSSIPVSVSPTVRKTSLPTSKGPVPATEETLKIAGVSVNVWTAPDGTELVVPVGNSLSGLDYTPSEAWGYAMRNAVEAKDKEFFFSLTQSYLYYSNQASVARSKQGLPFCKGLMGWSPYLDPSKGGYPSQSYYFSAASDADLDVLTAMMTGFELFGDATITDTLTPAQEGVVENSINLKDLIIMAGKSFVDYDLGTVSYPGSSDQYYMLTNDNWGHNPVNPDYFDPVFFYNLQKFFESNGVDQSYSDKVVDAAKNSMEAIFNYAEGSSGWIGDYPSQYPAKANNFGYDAVRILMRFGELLGTPDAREFFGSDFYEQGKTLLLNLVNNINPLCTAQPGGTYQYDGGSGLSQAQFTGPLLMALTALKKTGVTEISTASGNQSIDSVIDTVTACFNVDMTNYNTNGGMSGWQPFYFSVELGVLDEALMGRLTSIVKSLFNAKI